MAYSLQQLEQSMGVHYRNGKHDEVFNLGCLALQNVGASHNVKLYMSNVVRSVRIVEFHPMIKNAILQCMSDYRIEHQKFIGMWTLILYRDPVLGPFITMEDDLPDSFWEENAQALNDDFFLTGLRCCLNVDERIERFLVKLRRHLLMQAWQKGIFKTKDLNVICTIAEQCFNNEYCFPVTEQEMKSVQSLPMDDPVAVALRGMYTSLRDIEGIAKLSAQKSYRSMINVQVREPLREREIKATLKTVGGRKDDVSEKVKAQYEDNPYPRWITLDVASVPHVPNREGNILVAGCGTGRMSVQLGLSCPAMHVSAVDISRTSLACAQRKSEDYNLKNITFLECDILNLDQIGKTYDVINCSGVLHHMNDPVAGWKKLIERLAPGGVMLIGLYSTQARKLIYELRDFVKKEGYQPDTEGLRKFREDMMNLPHDHPSRAIIGFKDFFTLSDLRDLIFHVQETTYTISEIRKIMDDLDLELDFFKMPNQQLKLYFIEKYGEAALPGTLDQWDALEKEKPYIFSEMYNFVCHKKGDTINEAAKAVVDSRLLGP